MGPISFINDKTYEEKSMSNQYYQYIQSRIISGRGSIAFVTTVGSRRAAIIYDGRVLDDIGKQKLETMLTDSGCEAGFVADVRNEPLISDILNVSNVVNAFAPDLILAIGGGSVLDTAKAVWLFYEHPELSFEAAFRPFCLPDTGKKAVMAAVPTTSGTGSETTCCAVFTNQQTQHKQLMLGNSLIPTYAILDADFTDTMPDKIAAYTGLDALTHAIEASICTASSPLVVSLALTAAQDLLENLPASVTRLSGSREKALARELCHYSATLAGAAINNSSAGLVHALDQIGPFFSLPHGLVCGILLPYSVIFNAPQVVYIKLGERLGYKGTGDDICRQLVERLFMLNKEIGIPKCFAETGIDEEEYMSELDDFLGDLEDSMSARLSPRRVSKEDAKALLKAAYYGDEHFPDR